MALGTEGIITIIFYAIVIGLLIYYRKKFEFQAKIIALRRTKFGIKWMQKYADRHKETLKLLGFIGIGVGFVGMFFMLYIIGDAFVSLFTTPDAPAAVSPLIPGVNIPGSAIKIPLWVIVPLFFVVLIHEAGHGLVAKAHKVPILNTGIVFFGPIIGAFVEPDEKKLAKTKDDVRFSVFAAGPFFNALTAVLVLGLMAFVLNPLGGAITDTAGFTVAEVSEGFPAQLAGMEPGVVYDTINGEAVTDVNQLVTVLDGLEPGDTVSFGSETGVIDVVTGEHPDDSSKAYIGVIAPQPELVTKDGIPLFVFKILQGITLFFFWVFLLSFGLGAFNLLPLGPTDGGQMSKLALTRMYGEKTGTLYWSRISTVLFLVIIVLIFLPILNAIF